MNREPEVFKCRGGDETVAHVSLNVGGPTIAVWFAAVPDEIYVYGVGPVRFPFPLTADDACFRLEKMAMNL